MIRGNRAYSFPMKQKLLLPLSLLASLLFLCFLHISPPAREAALMGESRPLPIIMYHSVLQDPDRAGAYVVSPDTVRQDILYLQNLGYTCILPSEAIAFCAGTGQLPEKPVLITFDDGHLNNLTYVLPILEELDGKALINAVGSYTDQYTDNPDPNPNYAYLSWAQLGQLAASGRVEIGNHSYDLHATAPRKGILPLPGEDAADYRNLVTRDLCRMEAALRQRQLSQGVFAYPFGAMDRQSAELVSALGFSMTLTCREQISTLQAGDLKSLLGLGRYNRPSGPSSFAFFDEILKG